MPQLLMSQLPDTKRRASTAPAGLRDASYVQSDQSDAQLHGMSRAICFAPLLSLLLLHGPIRYRHLDLRRPQMSSNIRERHRISKTLRRFLEDELGFVEVSAQPRVHTTAWFTNGTTWKFCRDDVFSCHVTCRIAG